MRPCSGPLGARASSHQGLRLVICCVAVTSTSMLERCATCGDTKRGAAHKVCRLRSLAEETDDDADNAAGGGGRRLCGVAVVGSVACGCPARVALRGGKERARAGAKRANRLGEDDRNPAVTTKVCFTLRERALRPTDQAHAHRFSRVVRPGRAAITARAVLSCATFPCLHLFLHPLTAPLSLWSRPHLASNARPGRGKHNAFVSL